MNDDARRLLLNGLWWLLLSYRDRSRARTASFGVFLAVSVFADAFESVGVANFSQGSTVSGGKHSGFSILSRGPLIDEDLHALCARPWADSDGLEDVFERCWTVVQHCGLP